MAWARLAQRGAIGKLLQAGRAKLSVAPIRSSSEPAPRPREWAAFSTTVSRESGNVKFSGVAPFVLLPRVVIYDGVCHLCNAGVRWVIKRDKNELISFCAVQSEAAEPYLIASGISREEVLRRFIFIEGPGFCHSGSTAALKVVSYLPLPYSALSAFLIVPAPLRDLVYDYVAKRRYGWFGRSEECIVPTEDILHRFIDRDELLELGYACSRFGSPWFLVCA